MSENNTAGATHQAEFSEGDEIVLAKGSYQGTPGVFLHLKEDHNWADIAERDGSVRSHPLVWLAHAARAS